MIEKGIGQLLVETQFKRAVKYYLKDVKFDLIVYTTPPVTFSKVIKYLKSLNPTAKTYLLLKDIFPQNAVDLGMMSKTGIKSFLYHFFRKKEKKLYALSDYIGCMSPANVRYVIEHNKEVNPDKVEEAPNSYEVVKYFEFDNKERNAMRLKYNLPVDAPFLSMGGILANLRASIS